MQRSQFLAAVVVLAIVAGLFASRIDSRSDVDDEVAAAASPAESESADPSGNDGGDGGAGAAITGGEQASIGADGAVATTMVVAEPPPLLGEKPPLENIETWLQTDADGLESFDGQVKIVQFWTFGCHNCKATIPHLQDIYADHHDDGLEIIGVHAPEFDYERDVDNIANAAIDLGVSWPIAVDTDKTNFRAWQDKRRFWPRTFVLDQNDQVRFDRIGEGNYQELADTVAYLLANGP